MKQWVIKRTDIGGTPLEVFCTSKEEATAIIQSLRRDAERTQQRTQMDFPNGNPPLHMEYDYNAVARFDERKYAPFAVEAESRIFRLNTLPAESANLVREIMTKLEWFDEVKLCWTCTGHTRAQWQGAAAESYLKSIGIDATEQEDGDVVIRKGGVK